MKVFKKFQAPDDISDEDYGVIARELYSGLWATKWKGISN